MRDPILVDVLESGLLQRLAHAVHVEAQHARREPGALGAFVGLASGGSLVFHAESEVRYVTQCLQLLAAGASTASPRRFAAMEPRQDRDDEWYARCQAELAQTVWASPHIAHSFYKNAAGEVHGLSPWRLVDFWSWTRTVNPEDYVWHPQDPRK